MYSSLVEKLAEIVKQRRTALHLTQRALADQVGVSQTYIYNIENEKNDIPSPDVMGPLAKALGIAEELLLQSVGYLKESVERREPLDDATPQEFWDALVQRYHGDKEAARQYIYITLGKALEE